MRVLVALAVLALVAPAYAAWFKLDQGKERCFLEEVPRETLVVARFKAMIAGQNAYSQDQLASFTVQAVAFDPEGVEIQRRELPADGRFAITSREGGEYKICLSTAKAGWFGGQELKFFLTIDSGVQATDYSEVAKRDHLSSLEVEVRRLNDRIREVRSEQNYARIRERRFRDTSESTNARVAWWSVIQTSVLVATGLWQITHLKSFFKEKKLV